MFVAALAALLGLCNDRSQNCHTWMVEGHCESNPTYMHTACPLSCGICKTIANCSDKHTSCLDWKRKGECTNNSGFMLQECPTSCGLCTPECKDSHGDYVMGPGANQTMCEMWKAAGECENNPGFTLTACPRTCGVCKPKCKDTNASCAHWATSGECVSNSAFMLKTCPSACNVCNRAEPAEKEEAPEGHITRDACHDVSTECSGWVASGQCETNPEFMLRECAESCGLCTHVCQDHHSSCHDWAKAESFGCEANKGWMLFNCPASCGVCQTLKLKAPKKDEL